jgi:hypothetical protein
MQSPLQRLYKTKFVLVSFIATVVGAGLMVDAGWPSWQLFASLIGGALFTSGVIVIAFQYVGNKDAEEDAKRQFRAAIRDEAPTIRQTVVDAMAYAPKEMLAVTAPDVLDRVVINSLAHRLGNPELAAGVFDDLKAQVLRSPEVWNDLRVSATLAPWTGSQSAVQTAPMYVATFRYEYHVTQPSATMRFACVSDLAEYQELQNDPEVTEVWYFEPKAGLDATSQEVFDLAEVTVAGKPQKIRRTTRSGAQYYSVRLDPAVDLSVGVALSFMYRALVQRHGHVLHVDLIKPTHGVSVSLNYGGAGIRYVNVVDYIASAAQPSISKTAATDPSPSVAVTFDGWTLPKAGVAFVWVLKDEIAAASTPPR